MKKFQRDYFEVFAQIAKLLPIKDFQRFVKALHKIEEMNTDLTDKFTKFYTTVVYIAGVSAKRGQELKDSLEGLDTLLSTRFSDLLTVIKQRYDALMEFVDDDVPESDEELNELIPDDPNGVAAMKQLKQAAPYFRENNLHYEDIQKWQEHIDHLVETIINLRDTPTQKGKSNQEFADQRAQLRVQVNRLVYFVTQTDPSPQRENKVHMAILRRVMCYIKAGYKRRAACNQVWEDVKTEKDAENYDVVKNPEPHVTCVGMVMNPMKRNLDAYKTTKLSVGDGKTKT